VCASTHRVSVCVCKFRVDWLHVSWIQPMNWQCRYQKATSLFYKLQIWACFWHDSCRYKVWAGVRVGQKVPPCVCGWVWLSWQLVTCITNDDLDINQWRLHLTRNIRTGVWSCDGCGVCVHLCRPGADVVSASTDIVSMWIKIVSSWVCLLIYFWSLIAPLMLKNREFDWVYC